MIEDKYDYTQAREENISAQLTASTAESEDEQMLEDFFIPARIEIPNQGFSHKVMQSLPSRYERYNCILTVLCAILCVAFFIACKGWQILVHVFINLIHTFSIPKVIELYPFTIAVSVFVLLCVSIYEVVEETH